MSQKRNAVNKEKEYITAVVANSRGEIFELEGFAAVGAEGNIQNPLSYQETIDLPHGSELMRLPDRIPVLFNIDTRCFERIRENPYVPGEAVFPVAAFNSPGYVISHTASYEENKGADHLPLFSYGAVGWSQKGFRSAVFRIDREKRQDLRLMQREKVLAGVHRIRKQLPSNRLRTHLEKCALTYGCPAGKNFFLGRFEAPLPTSGHCNANCLGCISLQKNGEIKSSQERIGFTPTPEEISQVALFHINRVKKSVVSFGQGCEGDPLLAADASIPAIQMIRSQTGAGTINMNTNGSRPDTLEKLFDAGLDSMRVSINSLRSNCYSAYFQPKGYGFSDVMKSIRQALMRGKFVSINYLNCPGFTDTPEEVESLIQFLKDHRIHMIQWRNLNYDPKRYIKKMNTISAHGRPVGMKKLIKRVRRLFPDLKHGYFNPPKENW